VISAVVVAAGRGLRFGGETKKPFVALGASPLIIHALKAFQKTSLVDEILCVVSKEALGLTQALVSGHDLPKVRAVLPGGRRRQDSVAAAVFSLARTGDDQDIVLVHDGVRPLVSRALIERVLEGVKAHGAAVAACRVTDALKTVSPAGRIEKSLSRERVRAMQTPQGFRLGALARACRKAEAEAFEASDEAMLLEQLGLPVHCVEGEAENIKITTPSDLKLAAYFLSLRSAPKATARAEVPEP